MISNHKIYEKCYKPKKKKDNGKIIYYVYFDGDVKKRKEKRNKNWLKCTTTGSRLSVNGQPGYFDDRWLFYSFDHKWNNCDAIFMVDVWQNR